MTTLEELGLLKMDFLGLRNLTVLEDAVQMVRRREPDFRIEKVPEDDPRDLRDAVRRAHQRRVPAGDHAA